MKNEEPQISSSLLPFLSASETICSFADALTGNYTIIDVRSPQEFSDGSLPAAINIPVFDNDERKLIGTIYRYAGREKAIAQGLALIEPRLKDFLDSFAQKSGRPFAVFCARGGMRSRSVVNLLNSHGYQAHQLLGGYKQYRKLLLPLLENFTPSCIVIHGHTGTGKTRLLQHLEPMLDLEDLAQHQSSLFGGLNRTPRTQKAFDSHLHQAICGLRGEHLFIEGESRKMGDIYLPAGLAQAMKNGVLVRVTASVETRVARILEDYPIDNEDTANRVRTILQSLTPKLGRATTSHLCELLAANKLAELVHILLLEYYDKRYENSFKKYRFTLEISSENIEQAAQKLTAFRTSLHS